MRLRVLTGLALFALYVIWGSTYLAMRVALVGLPPFLMGGVRFTLAGAILYAVLRVRGEPTPSWAEWKASLLVGALLLVGGNGLVAIPVAAQWISSGLAAVVVATMPLWAAVLGLFLGARPTRGEWAGLLIGFGGVFLLQRGGELSARHMGALLILLAPVSWALGSIWSRRLSLPKGAMASAAQMLAGGVAYGVMGLLKGERFERAPTTDAILATAYLIVFGSIIAYSAYGFLLRNARPAVATSYAYVNPIVALALGALVGAEPVHATTWAAAGVIVLGVVVISLARHLGGSPAPTTR